ncbi:DUF2520 domain-containing protein [Caballeronia sp. LZ043]|nr:DUF2520 domain-containing protein [Caballeronia sp. LZ043]
MMLPGLPGLSDLRIGFIGGGRLALALAIACRSAGLRVASVASRRRESAEAFCGQVEGCRASGAQAVSATCDLVFITTRDDMIESIAASVRWRPGMAVVHCSGATSLSALDSAVRDGALTGGFHPMQSFGDPLAAVRSLPGCVISAEAPDAELARVLGELIERLGCHANWLPPGVRARYHAAAGYPSQFINVLLREAVSIWSTWGVAPEVALKAFLPMARGTLDSIEARGLADSMPGPVSRGDAKTVAAHVAALDALGPAHRAFYTSLCGRTVDLAMERAQGLDDDACRTIRATLAEESSSG